MYQSQPCPEKDSTLRLPFSVPLARALTLPELSSQLQPQVRVKQCRMIRFRSCVLSLAAPMQETQPGAFSMQW